MGMDRAMSEDHGKETPDHILVLLNMILAAATLGTAVVALFTINSSRTSTKAVRVLVRGTQIDRDWHESALSETVASN